jgi:hypothetical protein
MWGSTDLESAVKKYLGSSREKDMVHLVHKGRHLGTGVDVHLLMTLYSLRKVSTPDTLQQPLTAVRAFRNPKTISGQYISVFYTLSNMCDGVFCGCGHRTALQLMLFILGSHDPQCPLPTSKPTTLPVF